MNASHNPYIGPRTFKEDERDRFFGREREASELLARVISSQELVFYAQSGAGKSSLVNTCLIPDLKQKDFEVLRGRVGGDAPAGLEVDNIFVFNLLRSLSTGNADVNALAKQPLDEFLVPTANELPASDGRSSKRHALIIDQFEEIFSTHQEAWEKRRGFFEQLTCALEADPRLRVVLVMREDYIASLDPYSGLVPGQFRMRYYMQQLEYPAALKAVKEPVTANNFSRPYEAGAAEKLVDDLRTIRVIKPDGTLDVGKGQFVEPLYLQVICYELWNNLPADGTTITMKNVQDVGDVSTSLGNYYARRVATVAQTENVSEGKIRKWFTEELITASGIRNMVLQESGAKSAGLENRVIRRLSDLIRGEQRGGAIFYELTHDRMVEPILASNRIWFDQHLSPLQKQAALWAAQGRSDNWLLTDQALLEVEQWAKDHADELTEVEKEFLKDCQMAQAQIEERHAAERQQLEMAQKLADEQARSARRARSYTALALGFVVIALIASAFAFVQRQGAIKARTDALNAKSASDTSAALARVAEARAVAAKNEARSSELATIALERSDGQLDLALLLGLEADAFDHTLQAQKTLIGLLLKSGRYRGNGDIKETEMIRYSPDGKVFAAVGKDGITFWYADSLKPVNNMAPVNGHYSSVTALAISSDGNFLASGGSDGTVILWDAVKHRPLSDPFKTHNGGISRLAFNKDGSILASASSDETFIVLLDITDPAKPEKIGELSKNTDVVLSMAFSPDGRILASGGYDKTIVLWNVSQRKSFGEPIVEHSDWVNDLAFNRDGTMLASASDDGTVILWDIQDPANPSKYSNTISSEGTFIHSVAISSDDETLAFGTETGSISLWDISDPAAPQPMGIPLNVPETDITRLAFSPDGSLLASNSNHGTFILWNISDPGSPQTLGEPSNDGSGIVDAFLFKGQTLITGSDDSKIAYWDVALPARLRAATFSLRAPHPGSPTYIQFSPDGRLLESYGDDGSVLVDVAKQELLGVGSLLISPDGNAFAYQIMDDATGKNSIYLVDAHTSQAKGPSIPGQNPVFSPDNQLLIYETTDPDTKQNSLNVWDVASAKIVATGIPGSYLGIGSDGHTLAYESTDPDTNQILINIWDIAAGKSAIGNIEGSYLGISSDSKTVITSTTNPDTSEVTISLWDIAKGTQIKKVVSTSYSVSQNGDVLAYATTNPEGKPIVNLLKTSTGKLLREPIETTSEYMNTLPLSQNGKVFAYSVFDQGKNETYFLNTTTGQEITSPVSGYLNNFREFGETVVYELRNDNSGETSILLIDSSTGQKISDIPKASYADLVPGGKISDDKLLVYQTTENNVTRISLWDIDKKKSIGGSIKGSYITISTENGALITRNENNSISFWDASRTWPLGEPISEKNKGIIGLAISPDGKTLAWIGSTGILLQDISSGKSRGKSFDDHFGDEFSGVLPAFSPDSKLLAVGNPNSDTPVTILWNLTTGKQIGNELPGFIPKFSPDGKLLAIGNPRSDAPTTTLWNLSTGEQIRNELPGSAAAFSPDGKILAVRNSSSDRPTTTLWDMNTGKQIGNEIPGSLLSFSPDGKLLAVGNPSADQPNTTLWNPSTGKQTGVQFSGEDPTFSPDGKLLAVVDISLETATVWDLASGQRVGNTLPGDSVTFSPDGKLLAIFKSSSDPVTTTLWDVSSGMQIGKELPGYGYLFSADGKMLALSSSHSSTTTLWDVNTGQQIGDELPGDSFAFSPDGKLLAIGDFNSQTSMVWNIDNDTVSLENTVEHAIPATSVTFSADSKMLASNASDGIVLRNLQTNKTVRLQSGEFNSQFADKMSFSADNSRFTALGDDGTLVTWKISAQTAPNPEKIDPSLQGSIQGAAQFSPDGNYLVYESDNQLKIWDVMQRKPSDGSIESLDSANPGGIISFSPDGSVLAYFQGGTVTLYNFPALDKLGELVTGVNGIQEMGLILHDKTVQYVLTLDELGFTQIWDWATRTKIGDPLAGITQFAAFNSQDHSVVYVDSDGRLIKFSLDLDHEAWQGLICPIAGRNFTKNERNLYFPDEKHPKLTCPQYPPG